MLDLSTETVWGLYALHYLSTRERMTSAAEIARRGRIPSDALDSILRKLRSAGLIRSRSGRGYALNRVAGTISIREVSELLENPASPAASCMNRFDACPFRESCALSPLCQEAHERTRSAMRTFTIADLRKSAAEVADCARTRKGNLKTMAKGPDLPGTVP
jgi:Rrf2 family protein